MAVDVQKNRSDEMVSGPTIKQGRPYDPSQDVVADASGNLSAPGGAFLPESDLPYSPGDPHWTHFYRMEQMVLQGQEKAPPQDWIDEVPHVDRLRRLNQLPPPGIDSLERWRAGEPLEQNALIGTPFAGQARTSAPGELGPSSTARTVGGGLGLAGGAALGATLGAPVLPPFGSAIGAIALGTLGAMGGGAVGEAVNPHSALPASERIPRAASQQGQMGVEAETINQLGLRPAGKLAGMTWRGARSLSPTGGAIDRAMAAAEEKYASVFATETAAQAAARRQFAEDYAAALRENVGTGISSAHAAKVAGETSPFVESLIDQTIGGGEAKAQTLATQAERALPPTIANRSTTLSRETIPTTVQRENAPMRTLGAQPGYVRPYQPPPIETRPDIPESLLTQDIPPAAMIPRRAADVEARITGDMQDVLSSIHDEAGAIAAAQKLASNPDAVGILYRAATTPEERALLDAATGAGKRLSNEPAAAVLPKPPTFATTPEQAATAADRETFASLKDKKGSWPGTIKWLTRGGAMAAGSYLAGGKAHGPAGYITGTAASLAVAEGILALADKALSVGRNMVETPGVAALRQTVPRIAVRAGVERGAPSSLFDVFGAPPVNPYGATQSIRDKRARQRLLTNPPADYGTEE